MRGPSDGSNAAAGSKENVQDGEIKAESDQLVYGMRESAYAGHVVVDTIEQEQSGPYYRQVSSRESCRLEASQR
jgi:hypothetical protein